MRETNKHFVQINDSEDLLGPVFDHNVPLVTGNDLHSLLAAFNKRCNYHSNERVAAPIIKSARDLADLVFPNMPQFNWTEDLFDRWLEKFDSVKQNRMRDALNRIHEVDRRRLSSKELMVKCEVLLKRNDRNWAPRIIYVGSDEYNLLTGPILNHFNKMLVQALDEFSCPEVAVCFAYGKKDTLISNFLAGDPFQDNFYEGDFSSNDKTQVRDVREILGYWLFRSGAPPWFVSLYLTLSEKIPVVNREFGLAATITNQLATGATDTTARNTVWNLCQWYSYCKKRLLTNTRVAILGDDIAINCGRHHIEIDDWVHHCSQAQMILKASSRRFYCDLTFLSRFFIPANDGNCMVPLIAKALCRFNARANRNQAISDDQYMAGKCLSYAYEFRHVPFMVHFFIERFASLDVPLNEIELADLTWFSKQDVTQVQDVMSAIQGETVLCDDNGFLDVVMAKYDLGLSDMDDLCSQILCSDERIVLHDQRYHLMAHEVE
jgi:hypothetical protein